MCFSKLTFSRTIEGYNRQLDVLIVGTLFNNKAELKKACQAVATHGGFEYTIIKSDRSRFTIKCSGNGCPWHHQASAAFISTEIQEKLHDHSFYRPKEIQQDICRRLGIKLSYQKAIRAKATALQAINGTKLLTKNRILLCQNIAKISSVTMMEVRLYSNLPQKKR